MTESTEGFKIDVGSDQAHERLVADIYYRGLYVGSSLRKEKLDGSTLSAIGRLRVLRRTRGAVHCRGYWPSCRKPPNGCAR
jgi:hypothetical protein